MNIVGVIFLGSFGIFSASAQEAIVDIEYGIPIHLESGAYIFRSDLDGNSAISSIELKYLPLEWELDTSDQNVQDKTTFSFIQKKKEDPQVAFQLLNSMVFGFSYKKPSLRYTKVANQLTIFSFFSFLRSQSIPLQAHACKLGFRPFLHHLNRRYVSLQV